MPPEPVPADPGWDDDPAWTHPDPMTAEEFEASLDRLCELDESPEDEECADLEPFTAEELAEISQAAADELLAVEAATTGRRGPGQPGSARVFRMPARSAAMTTGSSSTPGGQLISSLTVPSAGPPRPDVSTPPNPPGIPSKLAF
jgi:hypothetical protein